MKLYQVKHLRTLARIAQNFASNPRILADITQTYEWLNSREDNEIEFIAQYKDEYLFLNVDDPKSEPWTFHCARKMFFNIPDLDDDQFACVGEFLSPFENLLRLAGVKEISLPSREELPLTPAETQLRRIRSNFNQMRINNVLTDVIFTSEDGQEFEAHRAFLATQNDYFRDLLTYEWSETSSMGEHDSAHVYMDGYFGTTLKVAIGKEFPHFKRHAFTQIGRIYLQWGTFI
jgi:hypothetical protein